MSYLKEPLNSIDKLALSGAGGIGPTICYGFRDFLQISLLILKEFKQINELLFPLESLQNHRLSSKLNSGFGWNEYRSAGKMTFIYSFFRVPATRHLCSHYFFGWSITSKIFVYFSKLLFSLICIAQVDFINPNSNYLKHWLSTSLAHKKPLK